jgi:isopentenyl diphosphate isomerase/L-lactate dehydrogenase-like FMN-dependent dehydrogenase
VSLARCPTIADVRRQALRRIPRFARAFLESGTGDDLCAARNEIRFAAERLVPVHLVSRGPPDTSTTLFGRRQPVPFGVAPIGLAGLIWPGAERRMANAAAKIGAPFCLSTFATWTIEEAAALLGRQCWFQLYPTHDRAVQADLLERCRAACIDTLVVTVDVPVHNRREGLRRASLGMPLRLGPRLAFDAMRAPRWTFETLSAGFPRPANLIRYVGDGAVSETALFSFLYQQFGRPTDEDDLRAIRAAWPGTLVVKGILGPDDARRAAAAGADALVVSNHGGRQLDAAPHPLDVLPAVREAVGQELPLLLDSGLRSGSDIAVALAHGADFTFHGRSFLYGAAAHQCGAEHVADILAAGFANVMAQLGCERVADLRQRTGASG